MMYEYRTKHKNSKAAAAVICCLFISAVALSFSIFLAATRVLLQCVGLCALLPAVQLAARYLVVQYLYRVRELEGRGLDLEVYRYRGGARMQLVCRVGLSAVTQIKVIKRGEKLPPKTARRYNYHPDMAPGDGVLVYLRDGDGESELFLQEDEELVRLLQGFAPTKQ